MNRFVLLVAFLTGGWLMDGTAQAVGPEVRDSAGLFSPAAVRQADDSIRAIQRNFHKDLLIETFASVPDDRKADYERDREGFFSSFVRERAQTARLNGVYVMLMKEPPPHNLRIQVSVGQATRQHAFLSSDRDQLVKLLQASFREQQYDTGLRQAAAFVENTMRGHLAGQFVPAGGSRAISTVPVSRNAGSSPWMWLLMVIAGIFVFSLIIRMFRGSSVNSGGGYGSGGGGFGGGGGGFFSSLLGGIGGAMAGSWLYDRFFSNNAQAGDNWSSRSDDAPASDVGGDYSSSGGDAGGSSDFGGGGDSGGGDSGGGDSGGGDA